MSSRMKHIITAAKSCHGIEATINHVRARGCKNSTYILPLNHPGSSQALCRSASSEATMVHP